MRLPWRERCIVILTADALRKYGLNITEYGCIEQAIHEVVGFLGKAPLNMLINNICAHLIVVFRETAVLHINMTSIIKGKGSIHYCPNFDRSAQINPSKFGIMPGKFTIILTSILKKLYETNANDSNKWDMAPAIRLGIAAYNLHFNEGFCQRENNNPAIPFVALEKAVSLAKRKYLNNETLPDAKGRDFLLSSLHFDIIETMDGYKAVNKREKSWNRTDALFTYENDDDVILFKIIKEGLEKACRHKETDNNDGFLSAVIICPYAEFGIIKTLDEKEITGFIDLANLIRKYLETSEWTIPLSIAVFGRPGSGKSTAIKQIIKSINPRRKSDPLTFNLAQFSSVDQLTEAFHQVQDQVLSSTEVPLIIFDEFDSCFDGHHLGWLKFFLAPMQDGLFRGKTGDYRVGRAIFLFSGGTSYNFKQFNGKKPGNNSAENDHLDTINKDAKLNDFISRLRGYLDVLGINEENEEFPPDRLIKLRRAILLRALLEKHAESIFQIAKDKKIADIHDDVIQAFLNTKTYKYEVRSMEAVIQMSRWINGQFVPASLPSRSQLENHVDIESFHP